ncbi:hypothetical protein M413DRAFT_448595 [Hebeloma cylindrosporum]|uniref:Uncharacterized protein n=1 Tax=Hebeloma cylindrosporum TaxID=76867 RepID=A0A0C2XHF7_HEBCY|nr:hypothetical protein M413DRAFT_448595 [Hebeloma cylindrosporum h7]
MSISRSFSLPFSPRFGPAASGVYLLNEDFMFEGSCTVRHATFITSNVDLRTGY